jgi:hypothetical protein
MPYHIGVLELYKRIGISNNDIISISIDSLPFYKGEPLIVPLNAYFIDEFNNFFPPSLNIIPVFF